mmetsp:Transcript_82684/g.192114  ORF Transcript_82684/g.192114 Transcript_82684/m.192114 type:complete len:248 (-) Transcript_82684:222-965(-)
MWTSKLNNKYDLTWIQKQDGSSQRELHRLRCLKELGNHLCADCGRPDSSWASITHGVFLCITCSDVHRSVGTHVSKVKGCTGTYLWGPDELERMRTVGNRAADQRYGSVKVSPDASKEEKQRYVIGKYEKHSRVIEKDEKQCGAVQAHGMSHAWRPTERPCAGAALLTSVPATQKAADLPDSLFDELFGDWTAPLVSHGRLPPSRESDHSLTDAPAVSSTKASLQSQLLQYGALDVVDDIFAELNRL